MQAEQRGSAAFRSRRPTPSGAANKKGGAGHVARLAPHRSPRQQQQLLLLLLVAVVASHLPLTHSLALPFTPSPSSSFHLDLVLSFARIASHRTDGRRARSPAAPPPARGSWRRMPLSPSGAAGGLLRRCPRAAVLPAAAAAATTARLEAMQIGGKPPCAPDDPPCVFQLLEDRVRKSSGFSCLILQLQRRLCAVSSCDAVPRFASFCVCVCVCPPAWGFRATVAWHRQLLLSSPPLGFLMFPLSLGFCFCFAM